MWHLFRAELLRFRLWAGAYALIHLLALGFMTRLFDLAQQPLLVYQVIAGIYGASGLLLGLFQVGGYRRPNTWLNLLHRPLPTTRIALALFGAGVVLLVVAVALPILAIAAGQDLLTARVVDSRHWLLALAATLIAACAYLAGAYSLLGGRRHAACSLVALVLLAASAATGPAMLLVQAGVLAWLAMMVRSAFKPDLSAPPRRLLEVVVAVVPLQLGVYYLLIVLGFGVETLWIAEGSHPNNSTPPRGGFVEANKAEGKDLMLAGLAASSDPDAALWREQVALSEVHGLGRQFLFLPQRHELTNLAPMEFDDTEKRIRWVFSHDRMRFQGYDLVDGRGRGELGVGTAHAAFTSPPLPGGTLAVLPDGDSVLLGNDSVLHYHSDTGQALPRLRLPEGEVFAAAPQRVAEHLAALTSGALYFYDGRDVLESEDLLVPRLRVPLPGPIGNLTRIELIELVDGYLLSFAYTSTAHNGRVAPYQQLLRVHDDGRVDAVGRRELILDYPALHRYQLWWLSPPLSALHQGLVRLGSGPLPLQVMAPPPIPGSIRALAAMLALLCAAAATWLTARLALGRAARLGWIATCAVVGVPGLISLWLLYPERALHPRIDALPAAPALAAG